MPKLKKKYVTITPKTADESLLTIDEEVIKNLYKVHGAILFQGFDFDSNIFSLFTGRFCTGAAINESGNRALIDKKNNIQTVNLGHLAFPLHPELARTPWKPDVCFFSCLTPPLNGGETTICDGTQIVRNLSSKLVKKLKKERLLYQDKISPKALEYWFGTETPTDQELSNPPSNCPYTFHKDGNVVLSSFTTPFFHKTMFSQQLAFGSFLLFARRQGLKDYPTFENQTLIDDDIYESIKKTGEKLTIPVKWQKNDVLMIDNTRFMHGRNEVLDTDNRLILSYFGYLKFASSNRKGFDTVPWRGDECHRFFNAMFQS